VNIKQELLHYVQQNLASFGPLYKCGQIYDIDFVANFMENTTVKKNENRSTFVKLMNECIVAQFYWDTVYSQPLENCLQ